VIRFFLYNNIKREYSSKKQKEMTLRRKKYILSTMNTNFLFKILTHIIVLLIAFPIHECAHALIANKLGDPTAKNLKRITLNPFAHIDIVGTILMLFTGFGWAKSVPINPMNFKRPRIGLALSALAGPISNLLVAYISIILCKITAYAVPYNSVSQLIYLILHYSVLININLAIFNFLPIPPLDGSKIIGLFMSDESYFKFLRFGQMISFLLIFLIFFGALDKPLDFLNSAIFKAIDYGTIYIDWIFRR
jgi:Zn-dependent protease